MLKEMCHNAAWTLLDMLTAQSCSLELPNDTGQAIVSITPPGAELGKQAAACGVDQVLPADQDPADSR